MNLHWAPIHNGAKNAWIFEVMAPSSVPASSSTQISSSNSDFHSPFLKKTRKSTRNNNNNNNTNNIINLTSQEFYTEGGVLSPRKKKGGQRGDFQANSISITYPVDIALVFVTRSHCARSIPMCRVHRAPWATSIPLGACYRRRSPPSQLSLSTASAQNGEPL